MLTANVPRRPSRRCPEGDLIADALHVPWPCHGLGTLHSALSWLLFFWVVGARGSVNAVQLPILFT